MITDKGLKEDKNEITDSIVQLQMAIQGKQQEINNLQAQLMQLTGALQYVSANISKPKEETK